MPAAATSESPASLSVPTTTMGDMSRPRTPLVGRRAELADLTGLLDEPVSRTADSVVISGDAGVGKTRLLSELCAHAEQLGVLTLVGHCLDFGDPGLPYLPFSEAFGWLAREQPDRIDLVLRDVPAVARLLPTRRLLGASGDVAGERLDRSEVFEAVLAALLALAVDGPVLLVVEDAHWADQSTRDLIGFLLARLHDDRISLVVSYRSDDLHRRHPLRHAVAQWVRLPRVHRVQVGPLPAGDVRTLIATLLPTPMPERQVTQIVERADGNPFFAEELVAASETARGVTAPLPAELAELLLVRLEALPEAAAQVTRVATVAGRRVTHELLSAVVDLPDRELDAALRDAIDGHVLESRGEHGYGFRHALLAEAVYDDLLPGERIRLHRAYAAALTKGGIDGTAAELARHARESHDLDTAYVASVRAGDEAMRVGAPQEAMRHYEAALELVSHAPADDADRGRLVRDAADAASSAGHPLRAMELIRDALGQLPDDAPPVVRAKLLYDLANAAWALDTDDPIGWTTEAVGLMAAEPAGLFHTKLLSLHAHAVAAMGRPEATRWAQQAIDMAEEIGQPEVGADARATLAGLLRHAGQPSAAARDLVAVVDAAERTGQLAVELRGRYSLGNLYYEQGDLAAAEQAFRAGSQRAAEHGREWSPFGLGCLTLLSVVQYVRGDWTESLQTADVTGRVPPPLPEAILAAAGMAVRAGRGDVDAALLLPMLRPWWERDGMIAILSAGPVIDMHGQQRNPEAAFALLHEVSQLLVRLWDEGEHYLARIRFSALAMASASSAVATLPELQRRQWVSRAAVEVEAGRASAGRRRPKGQLGVEGVAWAGRLEAEWARLRWLAGVDPPDLESHLELWTTSVADFGYGDRYEQARSQTRLAAVLRAAGRIEDAQEQAALARQVARDLQAQPLLDELRVLGTSRRPGASSAEDGDATLTAREHEVLRLLVEGRTNRQISEQLYISAKTVSVHVSNILAKLEVSSRAEAAALARRERLV